MQKNQDIFISHSGQDKQIIDDFIDLILVGGLSVPIDKIFSSSSDGTKLNHSALKVQRFVLRGTESPSFISFENEI